jgi:hypothetical protein
VRDRRCKIQSKLKDRTTAASTFDATARRAARAARVEAIRNGARVRNALGEAALYQQLDDRHEIVFRGERFRGATLEEVITKAKPGSGE